MSSPLVKLRRAPADAPAAPPAPAREAVGQVYVETYGCQMNVADTDLMLGVLAGAGYGRTEDPAAADVILLNTCAVREKAEERVFGRAGTLSALKAARPGLVLGITGCMAEHLKDKVHERAPYVDVVVGPDGYRRLADHLQRARGGTRVQDTVLDRHETYEGLDPSRARSMSAEAGVQPGVIGHVTIQRGCDKFCTFCVVPYTRGRERGTSPREVLRQARALVEAGYREVQLLGQTVNSYRWEDVGFADLLRAVGAIPGLPRVRFTSPYPLDFSPEVIRAIAETPNVCKHVHLPLQSGSDAVLARMRRGYDMATFRRLVDDLRAAMPDIAITTDILVGFCDETDAEFAETVQAMEQIRFDNAFLFAYSEREGTYAARKLPDTVPEAVKQRRLAEVIEIQRRVSGEVNARQVGRRETILIEATSKRSASDYLGRTDGFRSVIVPAAPGVDIGALVPVVIERANAATLFGRPVGAA